MSTSAQVISPDLASLLDQICDSYTDIVAFKNDTEIKLVQFVKLYADLSARAKRIRDTINTAVDVGDVPACAEAATDAHMPTAASTSVDNDVTMAPSVDLESQEVPAAGEFSSKRKQSNTK